METGEWSELERRLGHRFRDRDLLATALTHRSFAHEHGLPVQNERLEFLGDAILGLFTAEWLFRRFPARSEGELARQKSVFVSAPHLAEHARALELGASLRLDANEERTGGRERASILADSLEAIFAAVYLDGGLEAARAVVETFLVQVEARGGTDIADPKTVLQELAQARGWALPLYEIVSETGPDHERLFLCQVRLRGEVTGTGEGRTKKEAHQRAAIAALAALGDEVTKARDESGC